MAGRILYPESHWIRSRDARQALAAYVVQQKKAYSRIKNRFIKELIGDPGGRRVLDYGCGAGMFTVWAAASGAAAVTGVDAEESVLHTARYHARIQGVKTRCRFILSERFPQADRQRPFDVIVLKDVIEHIPDDGGLLADAVHCLARGGALVLSTQNAFSLNYLIEGGFHRGILKNKGWFGWDPTHVRFYTPFGLRKKLMRAGLRCTAWRSVYLIPYKLPAPAGSKRRFIHLDPLSLMDRMLGPVPPFNRLGWNLIVKAEKRVCHER